MSKGKKVIKKICHTPQALGQNGRERERREREGGESLLCGGTKSMPIGPAAPSREREEMEIEEEEEGTN